MKLLRLKITDPEGFRSLPCGFEHHFRTEWCLQGELAQANDFAPFVCAGPNGSGKSNLLEVLAAIFYQLEIQRVQRSFLPAVFEYDHPDAIQASDGSPAAYELEYLVRVPDAHRTPDSPLHAHIQVIKERDKSPCLAWINTEKFDADDGEFKSSRLTDEQRDFLLPEFVLGYSSGENEVLSLPFFKMRFIQFDEYWNCLRTHSQYPGRPETRLAFLDSSFSQAVLLCNLLFEDAQTLQPLRDAVGIEELKEFRIVVRRSVDLDEMQARPFMASIERTKFATEGEFQAANPVLTALEEPGRYRLSILRLLEEHRSDKAKRSSLALDALRRCATIEYHDESTDTLVLDYWVNDATRRAFQDNFDRSPRALFQAFQVLLTLNLYTVSDALKDDLYRSNSDYVSETVPTLASDERVMRFKFVRFGKRGMDRKLMLKSLSDGEHQLLHSLGLCLLFRGTNSLFLLDEPETHFNPAWRASFISRLRESMKSDKGAYPEMLITTHSPFLISDSKPEKVLVFDKDVGTGAVSVRHPDFNTLGASINKITMTTFGQRETIGAHAHALLDEIRARFKRGKESPGALIDEVERTLGDSVEKILLIKAMLDGTEPAQPINEGGA